MKKYCRKLIMILMTAALMTCLTAAVSFAEDEDVTEITMDKTVSAFYDEDDESYHARLSFTAPDNAVYMFFSDEKDDCYFDIEDSEGNWIHDNSIYNEEGLCYAFALTGEKGKTYYIYCISEKAFSVEVKLNEIQKIEFTPKSESGYLEMSDSDIDTDWVYDEAAEDDIEVKYRRYSEPTFNDGDKLSLTDINGETVVYTFDFDTDKFTAKGKPEIDVYDVDLRSDQSYDNQWKPGDIRSCTMYYCGAECQVPVIVKADMGLAKIKLSKKRYIYNGKAKKPAVTVTYDGKKLVKGKDYTVKYGNNKNVSVSAYVVVKGIGDYGSEKSKDFEIAPKGTKIKKLKGGKKCITVKWKKQSSKMSKKRISGYYILVATDKKFKKNVKYVLVRGYKKTSKKITNLKAGKKYYVKVCTTRFCGDGDVPSDSNWSKVKTVKTKK